MNNHNAILKKGLIEMKQTILKIAQEAEYEEQELEFELNYQRTLTTQQRFELMFRKSREMMEMLLKHGYRKPIEMSKRP